MIRIEKPSTPPAVLATRGAEETERMRAEFLADEDAYRTGEKKFEIASSIYGHETVKQALVACHHGKCAFCEAHVRAVAHGDVEHFRPKKAVQQTAADDKQYPGYYWLAYDWANLLFACQICNQSHKGCQFPLADPARRARDHRGDLSAEQPLLIDPCVEDPEDHITFNAANAAARQGSPRGQAMIDVLGLNRDELVAERRSHLMSLIAVKDSLSILNTVILAARAAGSDVNPELVAQAAAVTATLTASQQPDHEFSALARAALRASV